MAGRLKLIVALLFVFSLLSGTGLFAQTRRLVVVNPGDAELRAAAARLRMCPEQVQNIRQLLEEAANLLPETTSRSAGLGSLLFRYYRPAAEDTVVDLVEVLGSKARQATSSQDYQRLTSSALDLIAALERYNPTLASNLEDQWPPDPSPQPATTALSSPGSSPLDYARHRQLFRMAQRNPEEALRQLTSAQPAFQYSTGSALINSLVEKGLDAEARRIADQLLASPVNDLSLQLQSNFGFGQFAQTVLQQFPDYRDKMLRAIAAMYQGLALPGEAPTQPYQLPNGQNMQVTRADQFLLGSIMILNNDQQFATKLAELSPAISEKMRSAGGYSALFRYNQRQYRETRRTLLETPDDQLESKFGNAPTMDLLQSATGACSEFPEKAEKMFDIALVKIQAETDLTKAVDGFDNLSRNCARCMGLLPDKWMSAGKELLAKARQKEQESPVPVVPGSGIAGLGHPYPSRSLSARLEPLLLAFKADTDFSGALQDLRAIEDKSKRHQYVMRVAQYLGNR